MATDTALVTITVDATVEANDDTATTTAGTPVAVNVLANDLVNGAPATAAALDGVPVITTPPTNGTVVWNTETNQFDYTPNEEFCGTDTFEYEIEKTCEGGGGCAVSIFLTGSANTNEVPFEAPGFEWGVTAEFTLYSPEFVSNVFTWDAGNSRYELFEGGAGIPCGDGENPAPGWTLVAGDTETPVCVAPGCI